MVWHAPRRLAGVRTPGLQGPHGRWRRAAGGSAAGCLSITLSDTTARDVLLCLCLRVNRGGAGSWNCYHGDVDDKSMRATIDAITDRSRTVDGKPTSLADLGFVHVGIDDGWQACGTGYQGSFHAEDGTPLVNTTKVRKRLFCDILH